VSFEHDGYEVFRGVVDQNSMAEVALAVHKACVLFRESEAQRSAGISLSEYMEQHPDRNPGVTREGLADEPYILGNLAALDVRFRRLIVQESLWQLAASLLSVQFADVVYHYAQVVRKPGRIGPALSWHRDYGNTYISTDGPYFVRLLIPVQGMGQENGGTGVVSRSNLISEGLLGEGNQESGFGAVYPSLSSGDVLALHSKTVHGGGTNRSATDRDLLAIQFGVLGARLLHSADGESLTLTNRDAFLRSV
jgi:ectoine hydroxylase-related dioxygenase (phytanoyl-CoA dioxygenase family)